MKRVVLKCLEPNCRDALESTARLALTFVTVTTGPGFSDFRAERDLQVHLSALALKDGCHLPDLAQELLEAVQAYGIVVQRAADEEVPPEWADWWKELAPIEEAEGEDPLVLEIR
ncbi:MAG: hypothetical protein WC314_06630 [Vulcanimicrobiota bacterium]